MRGTGSPPAAAAAGAVRGGAQVRSHPSDLDMQLSAMWETEKHVLACVMLLWLASWGGMALRPLHLGHATV